MQSFGFKIEQFRKLNNWKLLEIDATIPLVVFLQCPSCDTELRTLCTFVGNNGGQKLRVGCCALCGYVGYIDRPTKEWMSKFYAESWDKGNAVTQDERISLEVKRRREQFREGLDTYTNRTYRAQYKWKGTFNKNRTVCEIGCGYGFQLQHLKDWGFRKIIGLEASRHRAEVARRAFGHEVFMSPFENHTLQSELQKRGPFGLIYSHHVFEHMYDPKESIRLSSLLQEEGDYCMITLPNLEGEFSLGTLFFLPHLHTFTAQCLTKLLMQYGYEVVDDSFTNAYEISMVARKRKNQFLNMLAREDFFESAVKKFSRYFQFPGQLSRKKLLWASRDIDKGGYLPYLGDSLTRIEEIMWSRLFTLQHKKELTEYLGLPPQEWRGIISAVVSPLEKHFLSQQESSIEIQFEKNVMLAYK